jgi:predicted metalloprotease
MIAHEIGHHVQTLLGTSDEMRQMQEGKSQTEANKLSVALELQADFYAGWTHYNQQMNTILEDGDIDEALSAAHAVGDDAINLKCKVILFRNLLHGTSEQRKYWFMKAIKPVTLIKVILLMHRDKDIQPLKSRPISYFFTFFITTSTPI